jgi:hypothetical protein
MPPLKLDDAALDAVMLAARPLDVRVRDDFLQAIAAELAGCQELGPGTVNRVIRSVVKRYFDPPQLGNSPGTLSKYR